MATVIVIDRGTRIEVINGSNTNYYNKTDGTNYMTVYSLSDNVILQKTDGTDIFNVPFSDIKTPNYSSAVNAVEAIDNIIRNVYNYSGDSSVQVWRANNIDVLSTGQTVIIPINNGGSTDVRFIPTDCFVELVSLTGSIGTVPRITIGNNGSSYTNVVTLEILNLLTSVGTLENPTVNITDSIDLSSAPISVNVSVAATTATVMTINVYLMGIIR